ncbi:ATP-dependent DNA helicase DinG [Micrococcales bacterium KH10]|nr:ATP-dependent DNA helicase DinG [Micrococcales bacterium KH10]
MRAAPTDDEKNLNTISADDVLSAIVAKIGGQDRPGQKAMARDVELGIERGGTLLIQAGTGTGKSLGYLAAAAMAAATDSKRVVISTATLALQRQLLTKDVPAVISTVGELTGIQPTAAPLKGWHNYVCRNKIAGGYPQDDVTLFDLGVGGTAEQDEASSHTSDLGGEVLRLRQWAEESDTGDRDDLTPSVSDRAWRQVSVTSAECLGSRCPLLEECFAKLARDNAHEADIVVTNHALVGIAAAGNDAVLPVHDVLIVDEAHELVSRVTSAATQELSVRSVTVAARRARREGGSGLAALDAAATGLAEELSQVPAGSPATLLSDGLIAAVGAVRDAARGALTAVRAGDSGSATRQVAIAALTELFEIAERITEQRGGDVLWASRGYEEPTATIYAAPLDVSDSIAHRVLQTRTVVLTSATLVLGGKFEPFARTIGLWEEQDQNLSQWAIQPLRDPVRRDTTSRGDDANLDGNQDRIPASTRWRGGQVDTPFDYAKQGILYVARDLPLPGRDGLTQDHVDLIRDMIEASGGGALGLFTSRRSAHEAAERVRAITDLPILCQDDAHLPELIAHFAADPAASLFGTLSLWQGVDVVGQSCRLVIIDKIPFPRPDDPVMSARTDRVNRSGGNGFMTVAATNAALMLAQGAGRLIRSVDDRGVVAVLDPRLVTKRYGSFLLGSLPPFWRTEDRQIALAALGRLRSSPTD